MSDDVKVHEIIRKMRLNAVLIEDFCHTRVKIKDKNSVIEFENHPDRVMCTKGMPIIIINECESYIGNKFFTVITSNGMTWCSRYALEILEET